MHKKTLKFSKRLALLSASSLAVSSFYTSTVYAQDALPTGGNVASGSAAITTAPNALTVNQSTQRAVVNWDAFSIAQGNEVTFNQPDVQSATLNRVTGDTISAIAGQITSNGAVYIVNPNGIAITSTGSVQTAGGFIASTLDISDQDFNAGTLDFNGLGASGRVSNAGSIDAGSGAYVALLGGSVSNSGIINVPLGRVGLGSAESIALDLNGNGFMQVAVPTSAQTVAGDSLIDMAGVITASGGRVELRAVTVRDAVRNIINVPGSINADSATGDGGTIILFGGVSKNDWGGTVTVSGDLSARATGASGNGGFVETSGADVDLNNISVSTTAANGNVGTWLIDPTDFVVAASGGDITGAMLSANLGGGNVIIESTSGTTGTIGNIDVNDPVSWTSNSTLTLNAVSNINLNAAINASLGGLTLNAGSFGSTVSATAGINIGRFSLTRGTWTQNSTLLPSFFANDFNISTTASTFIRATAGNGTTATPYQITDVFGLQGLASGTLLGDSFSLANNIDASGTVNWNGGLGFIPIGTDGATGIFNSSDGFIGSFNGNDFSISGLTINRPAFSFVGFFGAANAAISNVNFLGGSISGGLGGSVGSLTGSVIGSMRGGSLTNVTSSASVSGANAADAAFIPSSAAGSSFTGGLVGLQSAGTITGSSATGAIVGGNGGIGSVSEPVGGTSYTGGLAGFWSAGIISESFATGNVTGGLGGDAAPSGNAGSSDTGGLIGFIDEGSISSSHSLSTVVGSSGGSPTGGISGYSLTGGLVGEQNTASITNSYFNGNVTGGNAGNVSGSGTNAESFTGGLVGISFTGSSVTGSNSQGTVTGGNGGTSLSGTGNTATGGLIGAGSGNSILDSFSNSVVTAGNAGVSTFDTGTSNSGGLIGLAVNSTVARSYATGAVAGGVATGSLIQFTNAGGFAGAVSGGTVTQSYATGAVTGGIAGVGSFQGASAITGGFTAMNTGAITQSYATGRVSGGTSGQLSVGFTIIASVTGGFVGNNFGGGSISQAYASGEVIEGSTGATFTGGFVGNQEAGSTISDTYWDSFSTTRSSGSGTNNGTIINQLSVTSDPAQSNASSYAYNAAAYANFTAGAGLGTASPTGWVFFDGQTRPFLASEVPASGATIVNAHQLQLTGLGAGLSGSYTLGGNINLSETGANLGTAETSAGLWASTGWVPLGTNGTGSFWNGTSFGSGTPTGFSGSLDGNGFTVSGLSVNRLNSSFTGLLGFVTGSISNLNLTGLTVTGSTNVGGLAGYLFDGASINGVNTSGAVIGASGSVTGSVGNVGGLAGVQQGASVSNSSSAGSVIGASFVGGLIGYEFGTTIDSTISNSSSSATVTGQATTQTFDNTFIGGLVGYQRNGTTNTNVSASGAVNGSFNVGGLTGVTDGNASPFSSSTVSQLIDASATGNVSGTSGIGGLAGTLFPNASLLRGFATGTVTATDQFAGGLIGIFNGSSLDQAYATGAVSGVTNVGGLIGIQASPTGSTSSISNAYATGSVTGTTNVGGLVGRAQGASNSILNSYSAGLVNNNIAGASIGGLLGSQASTIFSVSNSFWDNSISSALSSAGGTGLSTAQLQNSTTFSMIYSGWDFTTIWEAPNQAGQGGIAVPHYPRLRFHLEP